MPRSPPSGLEGPDCPGIDPMVGFLRHPASECEVRLGSIVGPSYPQAGGELVNPEPATSRNGCRRRPGAAPAVRVVLSRNRRRPIPRDRRAGRGPSDRVTPVTGVAACHHRFGRRVRHAHPVGRRISVTPDRTDIRLLRPVTDTCPSGGTRASHGRLRALSMTTTSARWL